MISSKSKISVLSALHVSAGLVLRHYYRDAPTFDISTWISEPASWYFTLISADAGLLGIWAAIGTVWPPLRLALVGAMAGYLFGITITVGSVHAQNAIVSAQLLVVVLETYLVLSWLQFARYRLRLAYDS